MNLPQMITLGIAAYGAALATYTAVTDRRLKKSTVSVSLTNGFLSFGRNLSQTQLFVEAANPTARPITIVGLGIQLPDGQQMLLPHSPGAARLPIELSEGTNCRIWGDAIECANALREESFSGIVKLRGFALDATGRRHISKPVKFNIDGWTNLSRQSA